MIHVIESAVDWFTAVGKGTRKAAQLAESAHALLEMETRAGNQRDVFQTYGYMGEHCGRVSYGRKDDRTLVQVSGGMANAYYEGVRGLASEFTRLDLQATVQFDPIREHVAWEAWQKRPTASIGQGALPRYTYWENSGGGETLYIGRGASFQMGRLYNKAAEKGSEDYQGCWRWEVQLRRDLATAWADATRGTDVLPVFILRYVNTWFHQRGCDMPFLTDENMSLRTPKKEVTDAERKLTWLRKAVRPTCQYLCENDLAPKMLAALGIDGLLDLTSLPEFPAHELDGAERVKELGYGAQDNA